MAQKIKSSAKRFGTRYGATLRAKIGEIEAVQRAEQKCPYCNKTAARWQSVGVFHCRKCDATFTSEAYGVQRKVVFAEGAVDDTPVEEETTEEGA